MSAAVIARARGPAPFDGTFAELFPRVTVPLVICERESRVITAANAAAAELYGCTTENLVGNILPDVNHDPPLLEGLTRHRGAGGVPFDVSVQTGLTSGDFAVLVLVAIDGLAPQRRLLELDAERFRLVGRATNDAIWEWDLLQRSMWWNESFVRLFGYPSTADLMTIDFWMERIPLPQRAAVEEGLTRLLYSTMETSWVAEHPFITAFGGSRTVYDRAYIVRDVHGAAVKMIGSMMDVTEQRQTEEALRKNEQLSAMGRLLAGVAHEVRNPLFAMTAMCDAYETEGGRDLDVPRYFKFMRTELGRLTALMQDLLDYGRPFLERTRASLEEIARSSIRREHLAHKETAMAFDVRAEPDLPPVMVDIARIGQVFANLLQNAIQHSPAGAVIRVRIRTVFDNGGRAVECAVEDSGPGFAAEDMDHVFEPFFSRRYGGTGMGLAIVQRIVEGHGGRVSARNRTGGGAVVSFRIPCLPEGAEP